MTHIQRMSELFDTIEDVAELVFGEGAVWTPVKNGFEIVDRCGRFVGTFSDREMAILVASLVPINKSPRRG